VFFAGCGDDSTTVTTHDLATASANDMSAAEDLGMRSCMSVLACVAGCGQNIACQQVCVDEATTAARATYQAFAGCVVAACGAFDGGSAKCTSATDPSATCQTCITNTAAGALNPGATCNSEYAACAGS